jgi:DoxX-like family
MSFAVLVGLPFDSSLRLRSSPMTVTSHHPDPAGIAPVAPAARRSHRIGVAISALVGAFLVFDAFGKLAGVQQVKDGTQTLGFPVGQALVMGVVLSVCVLVYAIPRTAVLGALGITAYLGGAVTANMRVEAPLFTHVLFAVYLGVLMWVGLALRRPQLLKIVGLKR